MSLLNQSKDKVYSLASSSTEEGEIIENSFPFSKSHLKFYFHPLTKQFIGKNTIPNLINFKKDDQSNKISQKLKKAIKNSYSYISFTLLDDSKLFFNNKFQFVTDLSISPINITSDISNNSYKNFTGKVLKNFNKKLTNKSKFDKFIEKFLFKSEEQNLVIPPEVKRVFALEDRVFENLNNPHAFIFFRVLEDSKKIKKYSFENIYYNESQFYEYLEIFSEALIKSYESEEIRTITTQDSMFLIHSGTTFNMEGEIKRFYGSLNNEKNCRIIYNIAGPAISNLKENSNDNIKYLLNLDLPECDYIINSKKVYKISNEGIQFKFNGLLYDDFM